MKKFLSLIILFFTFISSIFATHIVGGEITYQCLGFNAATQQGTYKFTLKVYRDCSAGVTTPLDNPADVGIFSKGTNGAYTLLRAVSPRPIVTNIPPNTNNPCLKVDVTKVCVQEGIYEFTETLNYNPNGYVVAYQRCCRNNFITNLVNPGAVGGTYSIELTALGQTSCNNSPTFNTFPPIAICKDAPLDVSQGATDPDGDQLVYSLSSPLTGLSSASPAGMPSAPPYTPVTFLAPFTSSSPLNGNPGLNINPNTGRVTATPTSIGQYVVGIRIQEYRNGVLLTTTQRDFQFNVIACIAVVDASISGAITTNGGISYAITSCDNNTVSITNTSTDQAFIQSYYWQFSTGATTMQTSNVRNPVITFPGPGTYPGRMVLNRGGQFGCTDSTEVNITIYPPRVANFNIVVDSCEGTVPLSFRDASVANGTGRPISSWSWSIASTNSNIQNPLLLFPNPGPYTANLTITDNNNCTATKQVNAEYYPRANIAFASNIRQGCSPLTVQFSQNFAPFNSDYRVEWDFGDGGKYVGPTPPTYTYQGGGVFRVKVKITSPWGCVSEDSIMNMIRVFGSPIVKYDYERKPCSRGPVSFTDRTTSGRNGASLSTWQWGFGDGVTTATRSPSHQYNLTTARDYIVSLTVSDVNGCSTTKTDTLFWYPTPTLVASVSNIKACESLVDTFRANVSPNDRYNFSWDFGDGVTTAAISALHSYAVGRFPVRFLTTSPNGCTATFATTVDVFENPKADFSFRFDTCARDSVYFRSITRTNAAGTALSNWYWDFMDGGTSTRVNPGHLFNNSGNFNVLFRITDANGCMDSLRKQVAYFPEPIVAVSIPSRTICDKDTLRITNNSYPIRGYTTSWSFGDGTTSSLPSPNHVFPTFGTYNISLTIVSPNGFCRTQYSDVISVKELPNASYSFALDNCNISPVRYTNTSTTNSSGTPLRTWYYNFADGKDTLVRNPNPVSHQPTNSGFWNTYLVVTDANGCRDTAKVQVPWFPMPFVQIVNPYRNNCLQDSVKLVNNSFPIGGFSFRWDFGDGTFSTAQNPRHLYANPGVYPIRLQQTPPPGFTCIPADFLDTIVVHSLPQAGYSVGGNGCVVGPIYFLDSSRVATRPQTNPIATWAWSFGDTGRSALQNPVYQYQNPGTYNITLTVTDRVGCKSTVSKPLVWFPSIPISIVPSPRKGCVPHNTTFTTNSGGIDISSYTHSWVFGDGSTAGNVLSTTHNYTKPGSQQVILSLISPQSGCVQRVIDTVRVLHLPKPTYALRYDSCAIGKVNFYDRSYTPDGKVTAWRYSIDNKTTIDVIRTQNVLNYTFPALGNYNVSYWVQDENGCRDSIDTVAVWQARPIYDPNLKVVRGCIPFDYNPSIAPYPLADYTGQWSFGDGTFGDMQAALPHKYTIKNLYDARLIIKSSLGCIDTFTQKIYANQPPIADFIAKPQPATNLKPEVQFTDNSVDAQAWRWDFGDSSEILYRPNPVHIYGDTGLYPVTLRVTSREGCTNEITKIIDVAPDHTIFMPNAFTPNNDGLNEGFKPVGLLDKIKTFSMKIWSRYGELIYETTDNKASWNGRKNNNGVLVPAGVYIYSVEIVGGRGRSQSLKGIVTIVL